jgi:hypothetical protein
VVRSSFVINTGLKDGEFRRATKGRIVRQRREDLRSANSASDSKTLIRMPVRPGESLAPRATARSFRSALFMPILNPSFRSDFEHARSEYAVRQHRDCTRSFATALQISSWPKRLSGRRRTSNSETGLDVWRATQRESITRKLT